MTLDDAPRTLRSPEAIALRRAMFTEPKSHRSRRTSRAVRLRHPDWEFQDFDPLDGGRDRGGHAVPPGKTRSHDFTHSTSA